MGLFCGGQWDYGTVPRTTHHALSRCPLFDRRNYSTISEQHSEIVENWAMYIPHILVSCQSYFRPQGGHYPDWHAFGHKAQGDLERD